MQIQSEITRLKALREFGGALGKPYADWTDEEKRACCMLDMLWRREKGFTDRPDPDDQEHVSVLGRKLYESDPAIREGWRAGIMRLGGEWTKAEAAKYQSDPRFLRHLHEGLTKLWKKARELFGFRDKDDVSPFEAVRAEKMLETPGLDFEAETRRILKEDYMYRPSPDPVRNMLINEGLRDAADFADSLPPDERRRFDDRAIKAGSNLSWLEKQAAGKFPEGSDELLAECWKIRQDFGKALKDLVNETRQRMEQGAITDRDMVRKALRQKELAKVIHSRTFAAALEKPFSDWTAEERTSCHVLDAIWREENGLSIEPRLKNDAHWNRLCRSIREADAGDLKIWKADIASAGGAALRKLKSDYDGQAGYWKITWNHLQKAFGRLAGSLPDVSPFEAIRAQKVLDDPKIDIAQATREIQRHALDPGDMRRSMGFMAPKTEMEPCMAQNVRDGRFEGEMYRSIVSDAYMDGDLSKGDPVDFRISGPGGHFRVRAMSREDGCLNGAIKGATGLFWERCNEIRMSALAQLEESGILNIATGNGGRVLAARGSAIAAVETAEEAILAKMKAQERERMTHDADAGIEPGRGAEPSPAMGM